MRKIAVLLLAAVLAALAACTTNASDGEISRERAIEIARQHVTFEPKSIEAEKATEEGRPVWRVTFRGEPLGPTHPMGELQVIVVDRQTAEVVSLAMT